MAEISEMIQARKEYVNLIKNELLGPGSEISIPDIIRQKNTSRKVLTMQAPMWESVC